MNILICESNSKLVGKHIVKFQKVFHNSSFDYAQNKLEAIERINLYGNTYNYILSNYDLEEKIGLEIYRYIREKNITSTFILCSDLDSIHGIEDIKDEELFHLSKSYKSNDINKIVDIMISNLYRQAAVEPLI